MVEKSVKYQDSFGYYEIMYNLYRNVIKSSLSTNLKKLYTIESYYSTVCELYDFVEPFLDKNSTEGKLKYIFNKMLIDNPEIEFMLSKHGMKPKEINQIRKHSNKEINVYIREQLDSVERKLDETKVYANNPTQELTKRTKAIRTLLHSIKHTLAREMATNRLTVPVSEFDANETIKHGYS